jgi:hypothetical protein
MLPLILYQAIYLELFQVMPYGVQGYPEASRQLLRGEPSAPLQFSEDRTTRAAKAER